MTVTNGDLIGALKRAIEKFLAHDTYLLARDLNERTLTSRLAWHLQGELPKLNVDVEYNDNLGKPKYVFGLERSPVIPAEPGADGQGGDPEEVLTLGSPKGKTVYPDIIAHERGKHNNLMIVEAKKTSSSHQRFDLEKLRIYTDPREFYYDQQGSVIPNEVPLQYQLGVFLVFPVGEGLEQYEPNMRWFVAGTEVSETDAIAAQAVAAAGMAPAEAKPRSGDQGVG